MSLALLGPDLAFMRLVWERPLGFVAFVLPLALLWSARSAGRPPSIATGFLSLWRDEREGHAPRLARPRRIPLAAWLLALALVCGVLALAGPKPRGGGRTWHAVLDRSPSMYFTPPRVEGGASARTRIEDAVARARAWLAESARARDRVVWIAAAGELEQRAEGATPPAEWLTPPRAALAEPVWSRYDDAGYVWISDRVPSVARARAGIVASGAAVVPGAIAQRGDVRTIWDGERLVEERAAPERIAIVGELPKPLARVIEVWAAERALAIDRSSPTSTEARLVMRSTTDGATRRIDAGRDGWRASGEARGAARRSDAEGALASWLGTDGIDVVTFGAGRIESAWSAMDAPTGDAAPFPVSWATLFDSVRLPCEGCVSIDERSRTSPEAFEPPRETSSDDTDAARASLLVTWLVLAALALTLAAFAVRK